jgi:hypothetical protein
MAPLLGLSLRALTHRLAPVIVAVVIAGTTATAWAYWTTNAAAGSIGAATAATVNQGATPSVTLTSIGREITPIRAVPIRVHLGAGAGRDHRLDSSAPYGHRCGAVVDATAGQLFITGRGGLVSALPTSDEHVSGLSFLWTRPRTKPSGTVSLGGSDSAMDFAVQYADAIIATKA